jgi:hypothetical protein
MTVTRAWYTADAAGVICCRSDATGPKIAAQVRVHRATQTRSTAAQTTAAQATINQVLRRLSAMRLQAHLRRMPRCRTRRVGGSKSAVHRKQ